MGKSLVVALAILSTPVLAQSSSAAAPPPPGAQGLSTADIQREIDAKVEAAKQQMRDEMRAQLAAQNAVQAYGDEVSEETRKLDIFVPNGYFRIRPELFNDFDLGKGLDPWGYPLFPHTGGERTIDGVNMRFRFEPTINVSEEVHIKSQIDALDNVQWGSTPDYAYNSSTRYSLGVLDSQGQVPPQAGVNSAINSINMKRVWGEVGTPLGILRFGRMGSQWGLGMLHNDGNCIDCDYGETVDRAQFVIEPSPGYFVIPMLDINAIGQVYQPGPGQGPSYNLGNVDDTVSFVLVLARRDTPAKAKERLAAGLSVFNYGLHFTYRGQSWDSLPAGTAYTQTNPYDVGTLEPSTRVYRNASMYLPDLWVKYERKRFRIEAEAAGIFGSLNTNAVDDPGQQVNLSVTQWGFTGQGEYRFLDGALRLEFDTGLASGDKSPGFGNFPNRQPLPGASVQAQSGSKPVAGIVDGPQWYCPSPTNCPDGNIRNFRFADDFRIDLILWRELLGGITDAYFAKPSVAYTVTEGLNLSLAMIYSGALYAQSTPSWNPQTGKGTHSLGIELDMDAKYETEDGFFADLRYGILFPMGGLKSSTEYDPVAADQSLGLAQAVRLLLGIKF